MERNSVSRDHRSPKPPLPPQRTTTKQESPSWSEILKVPEYPSPKSGTFAGLLH